MSTSPDLRLGQLFLHSFIDRHLVLLEAHLVHQHGQLHLEFAFFGVVGGEVDEVVVLAGVRLQVVELGHVAVFGVIAMRVVNVLPVRGANAADVWRVGELLFVVQVKSYTIQ